MCSVTQLYSLQHNSRWYLSVTLCNPKDYNLSRLLCLWNFLGKNIGVGWLFPTPGHLPEPGIKHTSPALQTISCITREFFITESPGKFSWCLQSRNYAYLHLTSFQNLDWPLDAFCFLAFYSIWPSFMCSLSWNKFEEHKSTSNADPV